LWRVAAIIAVVGVVALSTLAKLQVPGSVWTSGVDTEKVANGWANLVSDGGTWLSGAAAVVSIYLSGRARSKQEVQIASERSRQQVEIATLKLKHLMSTHTQTLLTNIALALDGETWKGLTVKLYCAIDSASPPRLEVVAKSSNTERISSGLVWTKGKGCIGRAWEQGVSITTNLEQEDRSQAAKSEQDWNAADPEITQGLSWDELQKVVGQPYGAVLALPIFHSDIDPPKVVGVLALDVPASLHDDLRNEHNEVTRLAATQVKYLRPELSSLWRLLQG